MSRLALLCLGWLVLPLAAPAAAPPPREREYSVEELARRARPSVVVISIRGRDGKPESLGTGFVLSADGLIATNHHVIGEGRTILVKTADGKRYEAVSVHATDRKGDLALIRIAARGLLPLRLGDDARLRDGQAVVAVGNPKGLEHSVVAGVVSGRRVLGGRSMIQVAIPVEPGNSGGPLLDRAGRVVGLMTSKSLVTANLGFAVGVNALRPLLAKPNPVPMAAWRTIGALDADDWLMVGGGRWRQRAGQIIGEGAGGGFGGRALCLANKPAPALPFEAAVTVKLDDEAGAAGLAFHADGGDRHYGFYPSNGRLRLVRFEGPNVFTWKVLLEKASPAYRAGEWNTLKVRLDKGRIRCLVNDQPVFDLEEDEFTSGKVGLARFRDTTARYKRFAVAAKLPASRPAAALLARVGRALEGADPDAVVGEDRLKKMPRGQPETLAALREQARRLEQQAAQLRKVALALHQREVTAELRKVLGGKEIDLLHAALLVGKLDNDEVDVDAYRAEVDRMGRKIRDRLPAGASDVQKLAALDRFLFREKGFHGSRGDYYNRSNSYLAEVIDDREGLPITLSVLYLELARRLGVRAEGVGLPGHFIVRARPKNAPAQLIDVFAGGERLTRAAVAERVRESADRALEEADLAAVPAKGIVVRVLHNLLNVARQERDAAGMLRYLDAIVAVEPRAAAERAMRSALRFGQGDRAGAREDVDWLLEHEPEGIDLDRVRQMRRFLERAEREAGGR
jgi:regulator of sirC expression with transglutaminase-like and TPR domain